MADRARDELETRVREEVRGKVISSVVSSPHLQCLGDGQEHRSGDSWIFMGLRFSQEPWEKLSTREG
jgi:hypothetical protein